MIMDPISMSLQSPETNRLLFALESLLAIEAVGLRETLAAACEVLLTATQSDKIDIFLLNPEANTLVAMGISDTPMAARQKAIGMDRLPLANGGREAEVFNTGKSYISGHVDLDTGALKGFRFELGAHSMMIVPLDINGERQGAIQVASARAEAFSDRDLSFIEAAARWVGMVVHRAQLAERVANESSEQARRLAADELITVLAHDLNNYITPIKGRVDLLRRRISRRNPDSTDDGRRDLQDVEAILLGARRLGDMVSDLMDIDRLERGVFFISPELVNLGGLASETIKTLSTDEHAIKLDVATQEEIVVEADAARLRQALENLLTNAIKHSPKDEAVCVALELDELNSTRWAKMTVRDRGPGVRSEMVPKLFTRFAPERDSTGLGLGLFMAHSIVEAHGGTLQYDPSYTDGASFCLTLPAADN